MHKHHQITSYIKIVSYSLTQYACMFHKVAFLVVSHVFLSVIQHLYNTSRDTLYYNKSWHALSPSRSKTRVTKRVILSPLARALMDTTQVAAAAAASISSAFCCNLCSLISSFQHHHAFPRRKILTPCTHSDHLHSRSTTQVSSSSEGDEKNTHKKPWALRRKRRGDPLIRLLQVFSYGCCIPLSGYICVPDRNADGNVSIRCYMKHVRHCTYDSNVMRQ